MYQTGNPTKNAYPQQPATAPPEYGQINQAYNQNPNQQLPMAGTQFRTVQPVINLVPMSDSCLYGRHPQRVICNRCSCEVLTECKFVSGAGTWFACAMLFCFTGICCPFAFCIDGLKDVHHFCPNCNFKIGSSRL